jgi:hypothetical protein
MSKKLAYELVHASEYQDRDGQKKTKWTKCGIALRDDVTGNLSIKLEALPLGITGPLWLSLFEPKPRDEQGGGNGGATPGHKPANPDEDVPF